MTQSLTFEYNRLYSPSAPHVEVAIDGYDERYQPVALFAFVDSGADGTMLPIDILKSVGAEYADTVIMRGVAGGVQRLDRYTIRLRIGNQTVHSIEAVALDRGSEPILGRDVLNTLSLLLNGPANVTELLFD
ncbi:MAG: retropepsin-like aspartic protease [Chloroflexota bacterium]